MKAAMRASYKLSRSLVGRDDPSGVFQSKVVVNRLAEFLLAAEIAYRCLNRGVPKQKLNLFKFSARQMA